MAMTVVKGKAKVWAQGNWIEEARVRTEEYHRRGPSGPAVWVLTQGKSIPNGAIPTGNEHGQNLYTSRSLHEVSSLKLLALVSFLFSAFRMLLVGGYSQIMFSSLLTNDF